MLINKKSEKKIVKYSYMLIIEISDEIISPPRFKSVLPAGVQAYAWNAYGLGGGYAR